MVGPKNTCILQKPTETTSGLGLTTTFEDIQSFKAVLVPLKANEMVMFDKDTVYSDFRLVVRYQDISGTNRAEVKEKNRVRIGSDIYDIQRVQNYVNRHYEIDLLLRDQDKG